MDGRQFGRLLVQKGILTPGQLQECLQIYQHFQQSELPRSLYDILLEKEYLTPQQVAQLSFEVGPYRLEEFLGQGNMAAVYRACHRETGQVVALKIMTYKQKKDLNFLHRFRREVDTLTSLRHPNLIEGFEYGVEDGIHYFAMELVEGKTLKEILAETRREWETGHGEDGLRQTSESQYGPALTEELVLHIGYEIARALEYIEGLHLVHRDIKPDNIMMIGSQQVKLCDLGLAKWIRDDDQGLTKTGAVVGTPYYVSPEILRGEKEIDIRSDIYSLGATLFHLLLGRPPFEGGSAAVVFNKHLLEDIPPYRELKDYISRPFYYLLKKMMEKDPGDRHQSGHELRRDMERVREGEMPRGTGRKRASSSTVISSRRRSRLSEASQTSSGGDKTTMIFLAGGGVFLLLLAFLFFSPSEKKSVQKKKDKTSSIKKKEKEGDPKREEEKKKNKDSSKDQEKREATARKKARRLWKGRLEKIKGQIGDTSVAALDLRDQLQSYIKKSPEEFKPPFQSLLQKLKNRRDREIKLGEIKKKVQRGEGDLLEHFRRARQLRKGVSPGSYLANPSKKLVRTLKKELQSRMEISVRRLQKMASASPSKRKHLLRRIESEGQISLQAIRYFFRRQQFNTRVRYARWLRNYRLPPLRLVKPKEMFRPQASWEEGIIRHPHVAIVGKDYVAYYVCGQSPQGGVRVAAIHSKDGMKWKKREKLFELSSAEKLGGEKPLRFHYPFEVWSPLHKGRTGVLFVELESENNRHQILRYDSRNGIDFRLQKSPYHFPLQNLYKRGENLYCPNVLRATGGKLRLWSWTKGRGLLLAENAHKREVSPTRFSTMNRVGPPFTVIIWKGSYLLYYQNRQTSRFECAYSFDGVLWWGKGEIKLDEDMKKITKRAPYVRSLVPLPNRKGRAYFAVDNVVYSVELWGGP